MQHNLWVDKSYPIFLYSGIVFFITHFLIYGLGVDQSYFGLLLAYIGYSKVEIYWWVFGLLWFGLVVEGINLGNIIYNKYFRSIDKKKKRKDNTNE